METTNTESGIRQATEGTSMTVKYYEVDISKHTKKGKRNETSMCILGIKEPTAEEALKFLARDIIFLYKCTDVDAVREISQEEAYSAYCMNDLEGSLPVFGLQKGAIN